MPVTGNARVKEKHRQHMEQYWPVFFTGMAIEFACLLFVHPTMFTLVVCLKTTVCTAMWFVQGPSAAAAVPVKASKPKAPEQTTVAPKGGENTTVIPLLLHDFQAEIVDYDEEEQLVEGGSKSD
jgi:hypothetical protein